MMFRSVKPLTVSLIAVFAALMLQACSPGKALRTDSAPGGDMPGTYTLILYGGNFGDDLETIALLDKEGDRYTFEPYAPDFVFRSKKGMTAENALREAEAFIHAHPESHSERFLSIRDENGGIIGYELRPLYLPITFGTDDVLDVNYRLKEDRVLVFIKLKYFLEKRNRDFDRDQQ